MVRITCIQRVTALGALKVYEGHSSRLSIQELKDGGTPVYKLEHSDPINAPNALFYPVDGGIMLLLDFHGLCIEVEDWPAVKTAADDMLALWKEYESSTCR